MEPTANEVPGHREAHDHPSGRRLCGAPQANQSRAKPARFTPGSRVRPHRALRTYARRGGTSQTHRAGIAGRRSAGGEPAPRS
jgi:hypothetical protein